MSELQNAIARFDHTWSAINAIRDRGGILPEKPTEAFTILEYADRYDLPYKTAVSQLQTATRRGEYIRGRFRSFNCIGKRCVLYFYIPTDDKRTL